MKPQEVIDRLRTMIAMIEHGGTYRVLFTPADVQALRQALHTQERLAALRRKVGKP